jgi:hypothetical protein
MLKITIDDSAAELRFRLEGRLSGPWVGELRQCWVTASSVALDRPTVLDLREVDFIDTEGRELLAEMCGASVRMVASTPLIEAMVGEIVPEVRCVTVEGKQAPVRHALFGSRAAKRNAGSL